MKDFSKLLQKSNLTPRERHFLLVADARNIEVEGKAILSEADKHALTEGWTPQNNDEVREYNSYNRAWRSAVFAETNAQTTYLHAKIDYNRIQGILSQFTLYPFYCEVKNTIERLEKIKKVNIKEAIDIINRQREEKLKRGQDIYYTIRDLAFELAGTETQEKLKGLYDDVDLCEFLDEVEELITLYDKKEFETITERVAQKGHNVLYLDYACIPTFKIAQRYAKDNNIAYKDIDCSDGEDEKVEASLDALEALEETLAKHAKEKQTTIEAIIKQTCLKWIGEGLLEKGDTAITQEERELINKWAENKKKASDTLRDLISKGTLKTGKAGERGYYGGEAGEEIITGESLYNSGLEYAFVKEFRAYVDKYNPEAELVRGEGDDTIDNELLITETKLFSRYDMNVLTIKNLLNAISIIKEKDDNGEIIVDIKSEKLKKIIIDARNGLVKNYGLLLGFQTFFKRLSKAYDMDLSYRLDIWVAECKKMTEDYNNTILEALEDCYPERKKYNLGKNKTKHYKDKELFIDIENIKPNMERVDPAIKEISELLGDAF